MTTRATALLVLAAAALHGGCRFETSPLRSAPASVISNDRAGRDAVLDAGQSAQPDRSTPRRDAPASTPVLRPVSAGPAPGAQGGAGGSTADLIDSAIADASPGERSDAALAADGAVSDAATAIAPGAPPGSPFTACATNADCQSGLICTADPMIGLVASGLGYCTALCSPLGLTGMACPQPIDGLVRAACGTAVCMLESCERSTCPSALRCEQTTTQVLPGQFSNTFECKP